MDSLQQVFVRGRIMDFLDEKGINPLSTPASTPASPSFWGTCSCLLVTTLILRVLRFRHRRRRLISRPIVSTLPVVPNAHWLFGHLPVLLRAGDFRRGQHNVHCAHTNENGISTFWFLTTPACSVLLGRHVRMVLMATSQHLPISLMKHHASQFLGRKMLLQLTGSEWRYYRSVVHRAFTPAALGSYQRSIERVTENLVASLSSAIVMGHRSLSPSGSSTSLQQLQALVDSDTESDSGSMELSDPAVAVEGDGLANGPPSLTTEVLPLMKLAAFDIFAETSLGKDLGCCSSLTLTPVASAFDYLTEGYTRRMKDLIKPTSVFYWLPTPSNIRHARERNVIRNFLTSTVSERRAALEIETEETKGGDGADASPLSAKSETRSRVRFGRRRAVTGSNDNLLTHMIRAVDEDPYEGESGGVGPNEALTDVLMTLLFAGYDTTSITLSYSLYLLSQHKEERDICLAEIDAVMDDAGREANGRCLDEDGPVLDVERLQYTKAVVLESLRLFPPAPMTSRSLERELEIDGHVIPAKTHVNIPIWSIHHDERNFPFPDHFLPKRWVKCTEDDNNSDKNATWIDRTGSRDTSRYRRSSLASASSDISVPGRKDSISNSADGINDEVNQVCASPNDVPPANLDAFCAFSGGGRSCPGRKLAVQESVTVLAYLLRNFCFEATEGYDLKPIQASFIQKPKDDLPMKISLRRR